MGFFSDMIKMAASEVVNAVIDGVNESTLAQEERSRHLEEFRQLYSTTSYSSLVSWLEYSKFAEDELAVIKDLINEREQLSKTICASPEGVFETFDDDDLIRFYDKLLDSKGDIFPEEYAKKVVIIVQRELMSRPVAKRIYAESKEDYFESTNYHELETIILGNSAFIDEALKEEAKRELEYRNYIIRALDTESIDELENDEFMKMYAIVRDDKAQMNYIDDDDGRTIEIAGTYYSYFGEHRNQILHNCEMELFTSRKYLVETFISEYCEEEFEEFLNYSNKKLSSIISLVESKTKEETNDYDLCNKVIAEVILSERGCNN